jgi:hypothetical protein
MVLLQEPHPSTPHSTDPYPYSTVVTNGASPISVTMKPEDAEPKMMSVRERIRALNKSTNDSSKPALGGPLATKRAVSPWQVKGAAVGSKSPSVSSNNADATANEQNEVQSSAEEQKQQAVHPIATSGPNQIPDDELEEVTGKTSIIAKSNSSNSSDARSDEVIADTELRIDSSNTLHQFMLDSSPREETGQLFDEPEEETEGDFDASAAVKYWRRSKGETDDEPVKNEEQVASRIEKSNTVSTCDETNQDWNSQREINSEEVKSNDEETPSDEAGGHLGKPEPEANPAGSVDAAAAAEESSEEAKASNSPCIASKPPSPPVILRTVHSYPDMDAIEQKNDTPGHEEAVDQTVANTTEDKPQRRESESDHSSIGSKEKPQKLQKEKPATTTRSFSQRAFEKRSSRRKAAQQNAQTPTSSRGEEKTNDVEATAEVESASVFSGSTTHSASTIQTTTLSSRATRLLREKRQGNVIKTDRLATSLAKNLLRAKLHAEPTSKNSLGSAAARQEEDDVKINAQSSTANNLTPMSDEFSSKFADNSYSASDQAIRIHQQRPAGVRMPSPAPLDRHYSNPNLNHPMSYEMHRQPSHVSHVSHYSNPIQFGPSPSFQNVEVGITTGPTVYQTHKHTVPHYINPVVGIPHVDPRNMPNRAASIPSDLLVQPKFSRYNSFDVQNPKPSTIQNVLTEDSESWCASRTQDEGTQDGTADGTLDETTQDGSTAGGTQYTPVESVGHESNGNESTGSYSANLSIESIPHLDSFPKGRSFDKGYTVFEHIQNACDALSPISCGPEIVSNPTVQSNDLIHVGSTFSEDVAIEVEYVARSTEPYLEEQGSTESDDDPEEPESVEPYNDSEEQRSKEPDDDPQEQQDTVGADTGSSESDSIYSLSTRDMDSNFSSGNV